MIAWPTILPILFKPIHRGFQTCITLMYETKTIPAQVFISPKSHSCVTMDTGKCVKYWSVYPFRLTAPSTGHFCNEDIFSRFIETKCV